MIYLIKRFCLKKILLSLVVLFAIFLVYVIPNKQSKTDNIKEELIYVNKVEKKNKIFLLDSNDYLASTDITTTKDKINELAKELIEGLIIDSNMQNKIPNGFKALIPANTQVLGITIENKNLLSSLLITYSPLYLLTILITFLIPIPCCSGLSVLVVTICPSL